MPASIRSSETRPAGWDSFFWLNHQGKYCNLKQATAISSWLLTISLFLPIIATRVTSIIRYKINLHKIWRNSGYYFECMIHFKWSNFYIIICPIASRYLAMSVLTFHGAVWYCMLSVLINHTHAYSHLWQTLLPRIYFFQMRRTGHYKIYTWRLVSLFLSDQSFYFV